MGQQTYESEQVTQTEVAGVRSTSMTFYTIPTLAVRLGVHPTTARRWIRRSLIASPETHNPTGIRVFREAEAVEIERWYMERVAAGGSRGPGASERQARALTFVGGNGSQERAQSPAQVVTEASARWLELGDPSLPVAMLVTAVANRGDPKQRWGPPEAPHRAVPGPRATQLLYPHSPGQYIAGLILVEYQLDYSRWLPPAPTRRRARRLGGEAAGKEVRYLTAANLTFPHVEPRLTHLPETPALPEVSQHCLPFVAFQQLSC